MEIIDVDTNIKMHGYEETGGIILPTKELIDFAVFIEGLEIEKRKHFLGQSTQHKVLMNGRAFFESHFKLQKIPYKSARRSNLDTLALLNIPGEEIPLFIHNHFIRYINPFNLPVDFTNEDISQCMVVENAVLIDNEDFLRRMKISYQKIVLPKTVTEISESSYVHELTHAELVHQKGIIKNYHNREVLSIFLELLNVYESKNSASLLPLKDSMRLTELYQEIEILAEHATGIQEHSEEDLLDCSIYVDSIFKAYQLFVTYINGSNNLKKFILQRIQQVFNGELVLEKLLYEFELDREEILSNKSLKKYFTRI